MIKRHSTAITSHHHALAQALEIILATFLDHLRALPGHFVTSMLANSPGTHETWEPRLSDYIERVIRNVIVETYMSVRGQLCRVYSRSPKIGKGKWPKTMC
jgi:hypothetical protein